MDPGLVLEKNLTVVSVVAFNVLQAARLKHEPATTNQENTFCGMHLDFMMNLLSRGIPSANGYGTTRG
jgi:hypothetical protein